MKCDAVAKVEGVGQTIRRFGPRGGKVGNYLCPGGRGLEAQVSSVVHGILLILDQSLIYGSRDCKSLAGVENIRIWRLSISSECEVEDMAGRVANDCSRCGRGS